jgi:hypothetical protein
MKKKIDFLITRILFRLNGFPYRNYSIRNKLIFIHIPKAAGTSVLRGITSFPIRDHLTYYEYLIANKRRFDKYFKLSVVRNPYDRLESLYFYFKKGGNGSKDLAWKELLELKFDTYEKFVLEFLCVETIFSDRMLWPQTSYIFDSHDNLMVNKICKLESIVGDFADLAKDVGINIKLKHENKVSREPQVYSDEMIEKINFLYARDFKLLKYQKK